MAPAPRGATRPPADHGGVRVLPRHHRVEAGFDRRPHPGDRHLRLLPRRHHGHRQARQSHPGRRRLRHLPHHSRLEASAVQPRRHHCHLHQLPRRNPRDRQEQHAHPVERRLPGLPHHLRLAAGHSRRSHAGDGQLLLLPQRHDRQGQARGTPADQHRLRSVPRHPGVETGDARWITRRCSARARAATTAPTATGKTSSHIPTTAECGSCHGTTAWKPATFDPLGHHRDLRQLP